MMWGCVFYVNASYYDSNHIDISYFKDHLKIIKSLKYIASSFIIILNRIRLIIFIIRVFFIVFGGFLNLFFMDSFLMLFLLINVFIRLLLFIFFLFFFMRFWII